MIRMLALLMLLSAPAQAEEIVLGLSRDEIGITATFDGDVIDIYGAVRREAPVDDTSDLHVVITVAGPSAEVTVRRKQNRYGIWVNTDAINVDSAPSFYAVATTGPIEDVIGEVDDSLYKISLTQAIRSVGARVDDRDEFTEALIRIRSNQDLYQQLYGSISFEADTLFRSEISLPANLTEGDYTARIFLTRDGRIVDEYVTVIPVQKVGLERWIYSLAHNQPFLYGLMSLAIAIGAGWMASAAFQVLRRR